MPDIPVQSDFGSVRHASSLHPETIAVLSERFAAPMIRKPWLCDVRAANAQVIQEHNAEKTRNGIPIDSPFREFGTKPSRLTDLLWNDFAFLSLCVPALAQHAESFEFIEIAGAVPSADILSLSQSTGVTHFIGFRSSLMHFIHSAFSKVYMLTSNTRDAGCLDKHVHMLNGSDYSDVSLMAGLYNDIEILFDRRLLFVPIHPTHWANPYDYCGRVIGARRFILAHEVGHAFFRSADVEDMIKHFVSINVDEKMARKWAEEHWCDSFAINTLLSRYRNQHLEGELLYEANDVILGILTFTTLMHFIESIFASKSTSVGDHPKFKYRELFLREVIREHPVYQSSQILQQITRGYWQQLQLFVRLAGGHGPQSPVEGWSETGLLDRLSHFGKTAYATIRADHKEHWQSMGPRLLDSLHIRARGIRHGLDPSYFDRSCLLDEF